MIGWRKSSLLRQPITLLNSCFRFASREQIRLVENGLKLRIVYDASAKPHKSAVALNDCLKAGPSLNPHLFDILLRFREKRVAIVANIEKAFLNIEVHEKDRDSLRFLWVDVVLRNNLSLLVYRFCRVVYVFMCIYVYKTLFQHAIFVNYLHQLVSTKGVLCTLNLKYITRHTLIKLLITNINLS